MKLVFTVLLLVVVAGCGIGPQESPQTLRAPADTPSAALEPSDPTTPAEQTELRATVYLVTDTDDLVAVVRPVTVDGGADEQLAAVLGSLIEGPSDADADTGLRSAVPPTASVLSAVIEDEVATIDLSSEFASIGGPDELLAVGQFGLTATTFPGVRAVTFRLEGAPIDIPLPDGALTDDPVTLGQFSALLESGDEESGTG